MNAAGHFDVAGITVRGRGRGYVGSAAFQRQGTVAEAELGFDRVVRGEVVVPCVRDAADMQAQIMPTEISRRLGLVSIWGAHGAGIGAWRYGGRKADVTVFTDMKAHV